MSFTATRKIKKLLDHLSKMIQCLSDNRDFTLHKEIDQSFYMQKESELNLLVNRMEELIKQAQCVHEIIESNYQSTFTQWRRDYIFLHRYLRTQKKKSFL